MVCAPRFHTVGRTGKAFGKGIETLETEFNGHMAFILAKDFLTEVFFKILANDKNDLAEA